MTSVILVQCSRYQLSYQAIWGLVTESLQYTHK